MVKEFAYHTGDAGSIPGSGRCLRGGDGNPLHYSCQENPMDRGGGQTIVCRVAKSQTWLRQHSTSSYRKASSENEESKGSRCTWEGKHQARKVTTILWPVHTPHKGQGHRVGKDGGKREHILTWAFTTNRWGLTSVTTFTSKGEQGFFFFFFPMIID